MDEREKREFIERVERAARNGARKGSVGTKISSYGLLIGLVLVVVLISYFAMQTGWRKFLKDSKEQFSFENAADSHDRVIDDDGIFGYTAADFAEAMLGDSAQLKKLEVYQTEVSDAVTITDAGLAKLKMFSKNQVVTYNGYATYTVDLSALKESDIQLDKKKKVITLYIPHAQREEINIPSDQMEFSDTTKGWLAFGDIEMTMEAQSQLQTEATERMEQKLADTKTGEAADRFAKMSVWEIYQPIVSSVSPECKLEVEFK